MPTNINWNFVFNNGVKLVKISYKDSTGTDRRDYLNTIDSFVIPWPIANGGPIEYIIIDKQPQSDHYLFFIYPQPLAPSTNTFTFSLSPVFSPGASRVYTAPRYLPTTTAVDAFAGTAINPVTGQPAPGNYYIQVSPLQFQGTNRYTIPFYNSEYDAVLNNAITSQYSTKLMDVDYTTGITIPYNFDLLVSGTADRAPVQDSNYSSLAWSNIRYNGSRISSRDFNTPF